MARVTIEDCKKVVKNRFELVLLASKRARQLASGTVPTIRSDNEKSTVVSLREIGDCTLGVDSIRQTTITSFRKRKQQDILNEDESNTNILSAQDLKDIVDNFSDNQTIETSSDLHLETEEDFSEED